MTNSLDEKINDLAVKIEKQIAENRTVLEEAYTPDPKYRRMEEANVEKMFE